MPFLTNLYCDCYRERSRKRAQKVGIKKKMKKQFCSALFVVILSLALFGTLNAFAVSNGATVVTNFEELKIKEINPTAYAFKSLDGDVIEIGSERHSPPQPYLRLNRWDGEASLKVDVPYVEQNVPDFFDNRLKWSNDAYEVDFYPKEPADISEEIAGKEFRFMINENGGVEFDLILKEKPDTNVFRFPIESKGLKFYYQPALHPEHPTWADTDGDGAPDVFTSECVVGSYAVYHETQDKIWKTREEAEKYKTGKAFHIYRPKVHDAGGKETWGNLNIDETKGVLTVTIDRYWLDNAVYPVTIDPNFGYAIVGGKFGALLNSQIRGSWFTCPESGTAVSLSMYINDGWTAAHIKGAIYKKSDNSLVGDTEEETTPDDPTFVQEWYTFNFFGSPSLSNNEDYYLVGWASKTPSDAFTSLYYDAVPGKEGYQEISYGTWPNPWTPTIGNRRFSIYCTYTPSAAIVTSCDSAGNEVNQFAPGESVYVKATGLAPDTSYKIWIQDNPVNEGELLVTAEDPSGAQEIETTDGSGNFGPALIWEIPAGATVTHHEYDIVVDDQNGVYNAADDGLDSATVAGIVAPIPDVSALILFVSGLILVLVYRVYRRRYKEEVMG